MAAPVPPCCFPSASDSPVGATTQAWVSHCSLAGAVTLAPTPSEPAQTETMSLPEWASPGSVHCHPLHAPPLLAPPPVY